MAVVGSANLDIVLSLERRPRPGETVLGSSYSEVCGGKGANQAIAAARHGRAILVAQLGKDDAGTMLLSTLRARGVEVHRITRSSVPSGRAFIEVTPDGENSIVVMALANSTLGAARVHDALSGDVPAVVLAQLEVPLDVVIVAADWAAGTGARFVLNPSPVRALPRRLLALCDPLIVNESEAAAVLSELSELSGTAVPGTTAELAALLGRHCVSAVVTAGSRGACVAEGGVVESISGLPVAPVDTTGAGDEFAGALAAHLASGSTVVEAARLANEQAALAVATPRELR